MIFTPLKQHLDNYDKYNIRLRALEILDGCKNVTELIARYNSLQMTLIELVNKNKGWFGLSRHVSRDKIATFVIDEFLSTSPKINGSTTFDSLLLKVKEKKKKFIMQQREVAERSKRAIVEQKKNTLIERFNKIKRCEGSREKGVVWQHIKTHMQDDPFFCELVLSNHKDLVKETLLSSYKTRFLKKRKRNLSKKMEGEPPHKKVKKTLLKGCNCCKKKNPAEKGQPCKLCPLIFCGDCKDKAMIECHDSDCNAVFCKTHIDQLIECDQCNKVYGVGCCNKAGRCQVCTGTFCRNCINRPFERCECGVTLCWNTACFAEHLENDNCT
jgi:hypothetical protein